MSFTIGSARVVAQGAHLFVVVAIADRGSKQRNEWIKFQLRVHGSSMSKLARRLGVTRQAVRNALAARYPHMERVIAAEIGVPPSHIWPERYRGEDDEEANADSYNYGFSSYAYQPSTHSDG